MNDYTLELWTTWKETLDNDGLDTSPSETSSVHQMISWSINLTSISEVAQIYRGKKSQYLHERDIKNSHVQVGHSVLKICPDIYFD